MGTTTNLDFGKAFRELLPKFFSGAIEIVVLVTLVGFALAIVFGFLLAMGRFSKSKILNAIITIFSEIIRGTPLLVQLVYIYYVVPVIIQMIYGVFGMSVSVNIDATTAGIIGFTINYGTYLSEVIRSAILSIDNGQKEASLALGFSPTQTMFRIIIPQAFRNSVPVFGNYLVMLVKDTSLMAYITCPELLMTTKAYTSQTFLTIEAYTLLALVYLIICLPMAFGIKQLERKLNLNWR